MKKVWSLEEAQDDYLSNKKFKKIRIKSCANCDFSHPSPYLSCEVRCLTNPVLFPILKANRCKYYTMK
ncbi:hypothetical protein UT300012_32960 [Paraclostridium bifermentans]